MSRSRFPGTAGSLGLILALGATATTGAILANGCQKEPPPAPAPTPAKDPRAGANPALAMLDPNAPHAAPEDPNALFQEGEPKPIVFTLPELAFEERSQGLPNSGTWRGYPLLADFTGDGRADLVASNREEDGYNAWAALPNGTWERRIEGLPRDMAYGPARAHDFNGDGKPDLLLSAHSDALRIYLNDGAMAWKRTEAPIENPVLILDVAVGDLNGDAQADVAGIGHFEGGISVWLGGAGGALTRLPESRSILGTQSFGQTIEVADLDGDGRGDLVVTTSQGLKALRNKGETPMAFEDISAGLPVPAIGNSITAARVAQIVPGGWPEIVMGLLADPGLEGENRNAIGVYGYDASTKSWKHVDTGMTRAWTSRDVAVADLDKDGNLDVIAMSPEAGGVVYLGDGKGGFTAKGRLPGVLGRGRVTTGDIDGDGWLDVVVATPASKQNPQYGGLRALRNRPEIWGKN